MAKSQAAVVYDRKHTEEESCESDIWDDTALIKAYDHAVNAFKDEMTGTNPTLRAGSESEGRLTPKHRKKNKKKKQKKNKSSKKNFKARRRWQIGDKCLAVYSEDEQWYEALIVDIDTDYTVCTVRFIGYGNEEEMVLSDLLPRNAYKSSQQESIENGYDSQASSNMDWHDSSRLQSQVSNHHHHRHRHHDDNRPHAPQSHPHPLSPHADCPLFPNFHGPPPLMCPPSASMMPPPFFLPGGGMPFPFSIPGTSMPPPFSQGLSGAYPLFTSAEFIPPAPPIPSVPEGGDIDNDVLSSMLISWYMSGYHTGYYQGLKTAKLEALKKRKDDVPQQDGVSNSQGQDPDAQQPSTSKIDEKS
ncbi:PREDICTED: survival motor neuron protein-like [Priapulus caudatus]|uniref:Survival motor neuron protein-like n=1 Tax=Priapulus caudatus TaxID=37621 RepID=A0ABM1EFD6_PRICU|nr:PREDICTED: survival motor neuron protein-like [Priapulus caudatus]